MEQRSTNSEVVPQMTNFDVLSHHSFKSHKKAYKMGERRGNGCSRSESSQSKQIVKSKSIKKVEKVSKI